MFLKWTRDSGKVMAGRVLGVRGDTYRIERVDGRRVRIAKDRCSVADDIDVDDACMHYKNIGIDMAKELDRLMEVC